MTAAATSGRLLIEGVTPCLDGGRYAVKRLIGEEIAIGADVIQDGHDVIGTAVVYRPEEEGAWRSAPLAFDFDTDRWSGTFVADRVGLWLFSIDAWADPFATWQDHLSKKIEAGDDIRPELLEGAALVEHAIARAEGPDRTRLRDLFALLRDESRIPGERATLALGRATRELMGRLVDPDTITRYPRELPIVVDRERAGFAAWYEIFPRSQAPEPGRHGTFTDAAEDLERIAELGFDVVYLPPIHPIGHTYRKGRNNALQRDPGDPGSPWAIGAAEGGHTAVHPDLGTIEDFDAFVARAHELGLEIALDYALQCSPDHPWVSEHPDWFFVRADGSIRYAENPPKKYQDIYPLDFWCEDREALWRACRDVFLYWIDHGVRTFRVDNPHTKPLPFWERVIGEVKERHPDVLFLSEAFTRPKRMKALAKIGFSQSYTYFTWRNTPAELAEYLTELTTTEAVEFFRPNFFANTPDILHEYLQTGGPPAFLVRLVLAGTLSPLYGIFSGFELCENTPLRHGSEEYLDSDKYEIRHRDWNQPGNINADVARLNRIRRENPALHRLANLTFHDSGNERMLFFRKHVPGNDLLVVVNMNPHDGESTMLDVPLGALGLDSGEPFVLHDLWSGDRYTWRGARNYVHLDPRAGRVCHILRLER